VKALFLLNAYEEDGPGLLVFSIVQEMQRTGEIACSTMALSRGGPLQERFEAIGVPAAVVGMRSVYDIAAIGRFIRYLKHEHYSLLQTNLIRADLVGRVAAKCAGIPIIVTTEHGIHTWEVKGRIVRWLVRFLYLLTTRFTDRIVAVSEFVAKDLRTNGIAEVKITRIYNGIDTEQFRPLPDEQRRELCRYLSDRDVGHLVGIVGNMVALKGHAWCVEAIPAIVKEHPDTLFAFVGNGPLRQEIEELVRSLGMEHHVRFTGHVSALLPRLMGSFDVLVQPSLIESFGLVVVEAQACGVPVIATAVGGLPEIVSDGETGFLVPPEDPPALAEKVNLLLSEPALAQAMGKKGREKVLAQFLIQQTARAYAELYQQLASGKAVAMS
jgi:glycosyltransferase involved in cell wall biosynthesis